MVTAIPMLAQPRIHAHNDYQQTEPLINALGNKVYSIEADVYPTESGLVVVLDKKDISAGHLLEKQYLQPIVRLFKK